MHGAPAAEPGRSCRRPAPLARRLCLCRKAATMIAPVGCWAGECTPCAAECLLCCPAARPPPAASGDTRPAAGGAAMSGGGSSGKGTLNSFPVPSVVEDEERDAVDEEIHRDEDVSIKVSANGANGPVLGMSAMARGQMLSRAHCASCVGLPSCPLMGPIVSQVTQSPGFLCHIEATAAFRMPARKLFKQVITHPGEPRVCLLVSGIS